MDELKGRKRLPEEQLLAEQAHMKVNKFLTAQKVVDEVFSK